MIDSQKGNRMSLKAAKYAQEEEINFTRCLKDQPYSKFKEVGTSLHHLPRKYDILPGKIKTVSTIHLTYHIPLSSGKRTVR